VNEADVAVVVVPEPLVGTALPTWDPAFGHPLVGSTGVVPGPQTKKLTVPLGVFVFPDGAVSVARSVTDWPRSIVDALTAVAMLGCGGTAAAANDTDFVPKDEPSKESRAVWYGDPLTDDAPWVRPQSTSLAMWAPHAMTGVATDVVNVSVMLVVLSLAYEPLSAGA